MIPKRYYSILMGTGQTNDRGSDTPHRLKQGEFYGIALFYPKATTHNKNNLKNCPKYALFIPKRPLFFCQFLVLCGAVRNCLNSLEAM